jgi:hypothetical protein
MCAPISSVVLTLAVPTHLDADAQRLLEATDMPPRFVNAEFLDQVTDRLAMATEQSLSRFQPLDQFGTRKG